jgi:hypothetical protein
MVSANDYVDDVRLAMGATSPSRRRCTEIPVGSTANVLMVEVSELEPNDCQAWVKA